MNKKILKLSLVLFITLVVAVVASTSIYGATNSGTSKQPDDTFKGTINITYGENRGAGRIDISTGMRSAGVTLSSYADYNKYEIDGLVGGGNPTILTGPCYTSATGGRSDRNNNPYAAFVSTAVGSEQVRVKATKTNENPAVVTYVIFDVNCTYSTNLKSIANGLGGEGTMTDTTFTNNFPAAITADNMDAIISSYSYSKYNGLNDIEKAFINGKIAEKGITGVTTYNELYIAAVTYKTTLAKTFIKELGVDDTTLDRITVTTNNAITVTATKDNCETIIAANEAYEGLKDSVKTRVNEILRTDYPDLLVQAKALKFVKDYKLDTEVGSLTKKIDQESILPSQSAWTGLEDGVKSAVNTLLSSKGGYAAWIATVQNDLDQRNAEEFAQANGLVDFDMDKFDKEISGSENKALAGKVLNEMKAAFEELTTAAQGKTTAIIGETFANVADAAQTYLNEVAADEFFGNYVKNMEANEIISGVNAWEDLSADVQDLVNGLIAETSFEGTYPELVEAAKAAINEKAAQDFINDNLTLKNGEVIKKADTSNYKQILKASDAYKILTDEVKDLVNAKLVALDGVSYPELLKAAQEIEKNPNTGDLSVVMGALLVVSMIGIVVTVNRKRKVNNF